MGGGGGRGGGESILFHITSSDNSSDIMSETTSTRSNSISRGPRLGVAFDPNFVPGDSDTTSKVLNVYTQLHTNSECTLRL